MTAVNSGSLLVRQTCDCQRIDDRGDDEVGRRKIGDERSSDVAAGALAATEVFQGHHGDYNQVAQSSDNGCDTEHRHIQQGGSRFPVIQRTCLIGHHRTVHVGQPSKWKLHDVTVTTSQL